ncbi:MAG TPA: primary-amine oxidase [Gaiellaceae bacterium]|nr:primary-amine oxidase [Gaiellaceae bacterium]
MVAAAHPLDPLTEAELAASVAAVRTAHDPEGRIRFVSIQLREPSKEALEGLRAGEAVPREAELVLLDPGEECAFEAVVALPDGVLSSWERRDGVQPAIMPEEYEEVERLVKAHPDFHAALARRGIAQLDLVCVDPIPAGAWAVGDDASRRLCRAASWLLPYPGGNQYARPIEGVFGLVDLHRGEVVTIEDLGVVPVPDGDGEYRAAFRGPPRDDLLPLEIAQPEGTSFTVEGNLVRWQKWSFRVGFTPREGLVLHTLGYEDGGDVRPVLHRASICEMAVPYGDPTLGRHVHSPFDIGENLVGTLANSLELGCDCLGVMHYFDALVSNSRGEPVRIANAVCMHEEDAGILWKHWDFRTGHTEVRRSRRLVVSFVASIGNYDYGFFWYLYQDGSIEAEVKATGIVNTAAVRPGEVPRYGGLVAPGVNGMIHQHFFCARLDFDVDGRSNTVFEIETQLAPAGPDNPHGNAFQPVRRPLRTEKEAPALIDPLSARTWLVVNPGRRNAVGQPVGYRLLPGENVRAFAQPDSALARRAGFAFKHVWVTRYDPGERYAAGEYPNQNRGPDGLPRWIEQDRSIENEDVVVWYSFGLHHLPRPEDWPVMPVHHLGFKLKPFGFFDENPALDVPPPRAHADGDGCAC